MKEARYDTIGKRYTSQRRTDPRIYAAIREAIGNASHIVNIGAGTGSYEPPELDVVSVEPSLTMIAQRPEEAAPVVQAVAEALPFEKNSFDLALGVLTMHHWTDWRRGLAEAARVAGGSVLLFTWFGDRRRFWLTDYFPEIIELDNARFPTPSEYEQILGEVEITAVPIPHDCSDGFMYSYWRRPEAYLDRGVRNSISTFSEINELSRGLAQLEADLLSGRWMENYGELMEMDACDHGYRLVKAGAERRP